VRELAVRACAGQTKVGRSRARVVAHRSTEPDAPVTKRADSETVSLAHRPTRSGRPLPSRSGGYGT
jgi:hypothetical protein